jgi:hypothetical protein
MIHPDLMKDASSIRLFWHTVCDVSMRRQKVARSIPRHMVTPGTARHDRRRWDVL